MRKITADIVFTGNDESRKNTVIVTDAEGKVLSLESRENFEDAGLEIYSGALCPGLVNTHCHLELSHLKGKIPEKTGLVNFLKPIIKIRQADQEIIQDAIQRADEEMWENGIVAVGDISNLTDSFSVKSGSKIHYHTFVEILGIGPERAAQIFADGQEVQKQAKQLGLKASIVPHASYTVSPQLLQLIGEKAEKNGEIISFHNQECEAENEFYQTKTGGFAKVYEELGINIENFAATGKNALESTVQHLSNSNNILLVHNTFSKTEDVKWAHNFSKHIYWATCPNANFYIEDSLPDYHIFEEENAKLTIGTDSLTSNWQLSIWEEMKTITKHNPQIPDETLISWATKNGAESLGIADQFGSLETGKYPAST